MMRYSRAYTKLVYQPGTDQVPYQGIILLEILELRGHVRSSRKKQIKNQIRIKNRSSFESSFISSFLRIRRSKDSRLFESFHSVFPRCTGQRDKCQKVPTEEDVFRT